jgi:hypothetical protein
MASDNKSKNGLYFIIGALLVAVLGLGYFVYSGQSADEPDLAIEVSEDGIDIDTN